MSPAKKKKKKTLNAKSVFTRYRKKLPPTQFSGLAHNAFYVAERWRLITASNHYPEVCSSHPVYSITRECSARTSYDFIIFKRIAPEMAATLLRQKWLVHGCCTLLILPGSHLNRRINEPNSFWNIYQWKGAAMDRRLCEGIGRHPLLIILIMLLRPFFICAGIS